MRTNHRFQWISRVVILLTLALSLPAIAQQAAGDHDRDDDRRLVPYGPPGTPLPPGATQIDMTQCMKMVKRGALHLTTL